MKCPVCTDVTLLMSDKNGVEIDYCPNCRWIWLDRWEMEKLIQGEKRFMDANYEKPTDPWHQSSGQDYDHGNKRYKKRSFLESFDFFD